MSDQHKLQQMLEVMIFYPVESDTSFLKYFMGLISPNEQLSPTFKVFERPDLLFLNQLMVITILIRTRCIFARSANCFIFRKMRLTFFKKPFIPLARKVAVDSDGLNLFQRAFCPVRTETNPDCTEMSSDCTEMPADWTEIPSD